MANSVVQAGTTTTIHLAEMVVMASKTIDGAMKKEEEEAEGTTGEGIIRAEKGRHRGTGTDL